MTQIAIGAADALIVVDIQNDFLPGGALPVPGGDAIIAPVNALMARLPFGIIVATQDWHTPDHISFAAQGGPWPVHCVAQTQGAALASDLAQGPVAAVLRKGRPQGRDSYSGFLDNDHVSETGLAGLLRSVGIRRVFVCGLAYDFCVAATAVDAVRFGFASVVIADASCAIAQDRQATGNRLMAAGVAQVTGTMLGA